MPTRVSRELDLLTIFIDGKHHGAFWRFLIQAADDIDLRFEFGVGTVQPLLHMMGMQVAGLKDPMELAAADRCDDASFHGSLDQVVQGRGGSPIHLSGFASQRNQLQSLGS